MSLSNWVLDEDEGSAKGLLFNLLGLSPWKHDPAIEPRKQVYDCETFALCYDVMLVKTNSHK